MVHSALIKKKTLLSICFEIVFLVVSIFAISYFSRVIEIQDPLVDKIQVSTAADNEFIDGYIRSLLLQYVPGNTISNASISMRENSRVTKYFEDGDYWYVNYIVDIDNSAYHVAYFWSDDKFNSVVESFYEYLTPVYCSYDDVCEQTIGTRGYYEMLFSSYVLAGYEVMNSMVYGIDVDDRNIKVSLGDGDDINVVGGEILEYLESLGLSPNGLTFEVVRD